MAFNFPWTNLHELNLDWFLSKFKQFTDNYTGMTADVEYIPASEDPEVIVTGGDLDDDPNVSDPFNFHFKLPASGGGSGGDVQSVNGQTGVVVLGKNDIGLGNVDNVQQYSATNPPPYPVTSVNGQTGAVTIIAPVTSVNGDTGAVVLDKNDIGLGNVANVAQYSASNPPPYPVTSVNGMTGDVIVQGGGGGGDVLSVNGQTGVVVLDNDDIGLGNVDNVQQYSATNPPPYPVTSVNGQTGAVSISVPVTSVNGDTGAVVLDKNDIGLGNVDNVQQYSVNNPPPYPVTSVNGQTGAVSVSVPTFTELTGTANAGAWTGSAPYTNPVTVTGLLTTDKIIVDIVPSSTYATAQAEIADYAKIYNAECTANGTLTLYANGAISNALSLKILVMR